MYKKRFVSLVFSPKSIEIFLLSPDKGKVLVQATELIPENLISQSKVADVSKMAVFLSQLWKKYKIGERAVGIIIPEFATFTKTIQLPSHLNLNELQEAVVWATNEFLPQKTLNVMDWKIIGTTENKNEFNILTVSVLKDILSSYVQSCDIAGLMPILVETPSLSLLRLIESAKGANLLIYRKPEETLLVLTDSGSVKTSTTISGNDSKMISRTASLILNHFTSLEFQSIISCGNLDDEFINEIKTSVKYPISYFFLPKFGVTKLTEQFLLSRSMQYREAREPLDPYSINLLPPEWVRKYESKRMSFQTWSLMMIFSFVVWITFFSSIIVFSTIAGQKYIAEKSLEERQKSALSADIVTQITTINKLSQMTVKISSSIFYPQDVINKITNLKPNDVSILSYDINMETGIVLLEGISGSRSSLAKFRDDLENDANISLVRIPVSSFEKVTNLDFQMNFLYLTNSASNSGAIKLK